MILNILFIEILLVSGGFLVVLDKSSLVYPVLLITALAGFVQKRHALRVAPQTIFHFLGLLLLFSFLFLVRGEDLFFADNLNYCIKIVFAFLLIIYFSSYSTLELFSRYTLLFEKICALSLIAFVITNIAPGMTFKVGETQLGNEFMSFFGISYFRSLDYAKYGFVRNQAFFWEPGVFGVFIAIFYMIKVYYLGAYKKLWIYYAAIISTMSMGGLLIFSIIFCHHKYKLYARGKNTDGVRAIVLVVFSVLIICASYFLADPNTALGIASKIFMRDLENDSSLYTRFYDLYYGTISSFDKILTGSGRDYSAFYELTRMEIGKSKEDYDGGITNSIVSMLYRYGIVFLSYYFYLLFRCGKTFAKKNGPFVFSIMCLLLMLEPLSSSVFFFLILLMTERRPTRVGSQSNYAYVNMFSHTHDL